MDHIPLCSDDLQHSPIEVPHLCNSKFCYDDLGFHTYPHRVGVDTASLAEDTFSLALKNSAPFLQAWLWFGLLGEALRVGSGEATAPKHTSWRLFVKTLDDGEYLSTSRLKDVLSNDVDNSSSLRLTSCIETATAFLSKAQQAPFLRGIDIIRTKIEDLPDVFRVLLASQVPCQTLLNSFSTAKKSRLGNLFVVLPSEPQSLELINSLPIKSGWCQKEIRRLPRDVVFRYYLSFQHHGFQGHTKGEFTVEEGKCECQQTKVTELSPQHTHPSCSCAFVTTSALNIDAIILRGGCPLFRFKKETGAARTLEIRELVLTAEIFMPYVAISHVRMAGLGNDSANALPFCQLSLLQSLTDQLDVMDPDGTFFWIDTLCLPSNRRLRKTALRTARKIFAGASHVLVLDPPLYRHTFSSAQEALIRIRYSSWKRRVWTIEEGFLAKKLVFRFANCLITLDALLEQFRQESQRERSIFVVLRNNDIWPPRHFSQTLIDEKLPELLNHLVDDIYVFFTKTHSEAVASLSPSHRVDKLEVLKILRLGYLAASKFQYWIEDDECRSIPDVWISLLKVYGTKFDQAWGRNGPCETENILRCLRHIASMEPTDQNSQDQE